MAGRFVKHVTIEDDEEIAPGAPFVKTWRFRNESTVPWPENTHLLCVGREDRLSGPESVAVPKLAAPGEEVDISISLIAPTKPGRYTGYYRLSGGPNGKKFGQRVRVQIQVAGSSSSSEDEKANSGATNSSSWGSLLSQLDSMGFTDKKKNIKLLIKHSGDLDKVVTKLLKKMQKKAKYYPNF
jgi:next-to-BRCA1 protein 1